MKIMFKVLGLVVALGAVLLLALHLVMLFGLTNAMRNVVLPKLKQQTGIDARVGKLSINIPEGMLYLNQVEVRNPEGFLLENMASVDRIEVAVDMPSLFKQKPLRVKRIGVENAVVNVIRNKAGEFNLDHVSQQNPVPPPPRTEPVPDIGKPETLPEPGKPAPPPETPEPLPELLFESILCNAKLRYMDFKLNQLDIALALELAGTGLTTQRDPATPWGDVAVTGSLGNDRRSFITDLRLHLAPLTDLAAPSFDLTGKVLEIDPRILEEMYDTLGIRTAPFGFNPSFHCRAGRFENSSLALELSNIELEEKLSAHLGGMGSIGSLRFAVPVYGTLQEPVVDVQGALMSSLGGNARSLLGAFLKGSVAKQIEKVDTREEIADAAVDELGRHVEEIAESETAKKILKDLAGGTPSATNAPPPVSSDTVVDLLGEQVKEIGENEALKNDLKDLGRRLFGR